jgi:hypothetical protein
VRCNVTREQLQQEDERVEFEQLLSNAVHRKDWASAFQIAFKLNKPRALLNVVNQLFLSAPDEEGLSGSSEAQQTLRGIVSALQDEQLVKLFSFICDWNTTSGEFTRYLEFFGNLFLLSEFYCRSRSFTCNLLVQSCPRSSEDQGYQANGRDSFIILSPPL